MNWRRLFRVLGALLLLALSADTVWRGLQGFRAFQAANPGSGVVDYLLNPSPYFWLSILGAIGFGTLAIGFSALMAKWDRAGNNAEREDPDAESKRMFTEARGD